MASTVNGIDGATHGLIFSLPTAMTQLTAPAASFFLTKIPRKLVGTLGGVLSGIGFLLMGLLATEAIHYIALALISGIGFGLANFTAVLCLHDVAGDWFPPLMALGSLGSYVGVTVLPYVLNLSLGLHGLNTSFLFFGLLCCHIIPLGLLLPNSSPKNPDLIDKLEVLLDDVSDEEGDFVSIHNDRFLTQPMIKSANTGSAKPRLARRHRSGGMRIYSEKRHVMTLIYIIVSSLRRIPSGVWTLFLIPYVRENGLSVDDSILAGTLGGIGGVMGRFLAAFSFKLPKVHQTVILAFYLAILGPAFLGFEFFPSTNGQLICSFLTGLLISTPAAMVTGVLRLLVAHESFSVAFTLLEISTGIVSLFSGVIAGFSFDIFHTFVVPFRFNVIICEISALTLLVIAILLRKISPKS